MKSLDPEFKHAVDRCARRAKDLVDEVDQRFHRVLFVAAMVERFNIHPVIVAREYDARLQDLRTGDLIMQHNSN